jgi:6-phosphogluconolactonase
MQTLPSVPEGTPPAGISTAEIFCHPTGKWLYVSNRGHDTIAVYALAADGKMTWIENAPAQVKVPRGFGIDPTGRWLVAAGQNDDRIAVLKIDPASAPRWVRRCAFFSRRARAPRVRSSAAARGARHPTL